MNCNKLMFWFGYCQHTNASNTPKVKKMQHILNPIIEDILDKKNKSKLQLQVIKPDNKVAIDGYPELLLYILPKYKNIKKIATLLKQILKQKPTILTLPKEKKHQPLNLTFANITSFKYLTKQKNIKVFLISV